MKKMWMILMILAMAVTGCQCSNSHGDCVGLADDPEPGVQYKASTRNIILAIVFVETIAVPVFVAASALKCPVGPAKPAPATP